MRWVLAVALLVRGATSLVGPPRQQQRHLRRQQRHLQRVGFQRHSAARPLAVAPTASEVLEDDRAAWRLTGPALVGTLLDPVLSVADTAWVS